MLVATSVSVGVSLKGQATLPPNPVPVPGGSLDPLTVPKYQLPLVIPPVMPTTAVYGNKGGKPIDYYEIAVRQFQQQILPTSYNPTTVYGYGSLTNPATFNYPAYTIEARVNRIVRVKWVNQLVDGAGKFLPPILPVDQTLHWTNPPGGPGGQDSHGMDGTPYTGPVPIVTHLHGAHDKPDSDGYPEAWYLPAAIDIPAGYATEGHYFSVNQALFQARTGLTWGTGYSIYQYENDQRATTLWYHDHALGMTRVNVYSGLAGFYLLRGGKDDLSLGFRAPKPGDNPRAQTTYTEIPIVIQDKSFNADGSLFFPDTRAFFDGFTGPYIPDPASDISPIWNPEFFGNMMVVNGRTWPSFNAQARRYRIRFLNGCNARLLILKLAADNTPNDGTIDDGDWTALTGVFTAIGTDGGFLPAPVPMDELFIGKADRLDVIMDLSGLAGQTLYLVNIGPDEPFGGGTSGIDFAAANPGSTGQVMRLTVTGPLSTDLTTPPAQLMLPSRTPLPAPTNVRQVSLNELSSNLLVDAFGDPIGPRMAALGTVDLISMPGMPMGMHKMWSDPVTEAPLLNSTEIWEIYNFTMDAHPIHLHQVQFEIIDREIFDPMVGTPGTVFQPAAWELGTKDTVQSLPGYITRIKAHFDIEGLYVWHCHILDHEDNEMMRPYTVIR
jgi:bilirubin oxidase